MNEALCYLINMCQRLTRRIEKCYSLSIQTPIRLYRATGSEGKDEMITF